MSPVHRLDPYRLAFDALLVRADAEAAHRAGFAAIRAASPVLARMPGPGGAGPVRAMGLEFPSVLGLAAGFDKNAVGVDALAGLGFGFVEVGTVTGRPQPGNPTPRLFRLPADRAVVNRMGFNNDGAEVVAARLARREERVGRHRHPGRTPVLGVNIGKSKVVPEDDAESDYRFSTRLLAPHADYLVVNVSSPNTPGLRNLQAVDKLEPLLVAVREEADAATERSGRRVPLLVKIAPDLADDDVLAVADLAVALALDGIVATNTTTSRAGLASDADAVAAAGDGGLSGAPLKQRSRAVLRLLRTRLDERGAGSVALVGVGGISTADDVRERLADGADLVQAYTGFIYGGPLWPRRVQRGTGAAAG